MTIHTVVESLAAYADVRGKDPAGQRLWWTTSPHLLVNLPRRGETVRSPEEGFPQELFDGLAHAARDVGDEFCAWYQDTCSWKGYARFHFVLALQLTRCIFVSFYKAQLLSRVVAAADGCQVACVGRPGDPAPAPFSLMYGRMDTLFSALAGRWPTPGVEVQPHVASQVAARDIERQIRNRPLGATEKALSLLNNTPSSWLFKTWKNLRQRGWYPGRYLAIRPFPSKTFWVLKECELLQEAALGILSRGGRIGQLPVLPSALAGDASEPSDGAAVSGRLGELVRAAMTRYGVDWTDSCDAALGMASGRCLEFLARLEQELPGLTREFDAAVAGVAPGDEILSSALTTPVEGLFYGYCRSRGITVSAFDHGVTLGLSAWSQSEARQAGMLAADRGFYHCSRAVDAVQPHAPWQETHAVGLPLSTERPSLRRVQRLLGRRLIGLGAGEHVVMHVPELERNNFVYGPHQDNDWQFLHKTRQVTELLCRSFPRSRVVLKLYPTQRYMDAYDFSDLLEAHPNLLIVGDVDFRFLRACSDINFTASTQSTLGWVAGAGAPMLFLEFAWSPSRLQGLRMACPQIDGLAAMVLPDHGAACLAPRADVAKAIMGTRTSSCAG